MDQLILIDTEDAYNAMLEELKSAEFVAYDCETTGLNRGSEIIGYSISLDIDKAYYVVLSKWNTTTSHLDNVIDKNVAKKAIEILASKQLIMHNGIFDCARTEEFFGVSLIQSLHTDTMILAHLLDENRSAGLKELGKIYFGENSSTEAEEMKASVLSNAGKWKAKQKEFYKADYKLLGKYGAKDALLTYKLFLQLVAELYDQKLDKFFYEDESMPLLRMVTYPLNTIGLKVDKTALLTLQKTLEAECAEDLAFINNEIAPYIQEKYPGTNKKNVFNIGSSSQLSWLLFGQLQLEYGKLTKEGKAVSKFLGFGYLYSKWQKKAFLETCMAHVGKIYAGKKKIREPWGYIATDKVTLEKLKHRYKWIERFLEYNKKLKILNTYVKGIHNKLDYGIIRPSFLQHGTTSGRYSSRDPNFQNLPRDDKRIKSCIVARSGKTFVGADYSQLEPRTFAYFSKDKRLQETFNSNTDFYSVIGIDVYEKYDALPLKEGHPDAFGLKYKKLRDNSKVIALAPTYGATAFQLAPMTGKSIDDTQADIDRYFASFPDVKTMMLESHEFAKTNGYVENLFGRKRRMPEAKHITKLYGKNVAHADLPYEVRSLLNLAVNHRIQSTAASIVNRSAIAFYKACQDLNIEAYIVLQVHDSFVVECDEKDAETVSILLQHVMENTVELQGVRLEAIPKIGKSLHLV